MTTSSFWDNILDSGDSKNSDFWKSIGYEEITLEEISEEDFEIESVDAELDLKLAQNLIETTKGLPTDDIETTFGVCKCCETEPDDSELANGLCVDCWDNMVDIMPDYCNYDPSFKLWVEYGKPVLAQSQTDLSKS